MIKFLQSGGNAAKYLLGGLLIVLSASMVTYLIPGFGSDSNASASGTVATIAGHDIQIADVQKAAADMEERSGQRYPEMMRPFLMSQAANGLIQEAEINYEANRLGLRVSDAEVQEELRTNPGYSTVLFPDGKWIGKEAYERLLSDRKFTPETFEHNVRNSMLQRKLITAITAGADITPAELQKAYKEQNTKIKFDYAVITTDEVEKTIKPTDTELKAFFDRNKARYANSIPEKRVVRYFVIDRSQAESKVTATPSDLQKYFNDHQQQYQTPERVKVRHILVGTPAGADQKVIDAAKAKAEDLLKQLKNGADFAETAKKYSDDPGSKTQGGELGWITRGQMVAPFEEASFAMNKGQMSDLVKSNFGFHIIQVEDKQAASVKSFSEVHDEIEKAVKEQKGGEVLGNMAELYQKDADSEGLAKAAAKAGSQVIVSNPVALNDTLPGLSSSQDFMQAVFGANLKSLPQAVGVGNGVAIFELARIDPPKSPDFESIKDKVTKNFKSEQAGRKLEEKLKEMADRAHSEHDLRKAAKEAGATVKTSDLVAGKDQVPDIGSMSGQARDAFNLKPGEISGPINLGTKGVVIALLERKEPSAEEAAKGSDEIREELLQKKRQQLLEIYMSNLKTRMEKEGKEKIYKGPMEQLTRGRG
ncbi:MAG TPA: peptidylprolyl isomerase [Nitrososphaera sp.]|nr:peptidylprolyl isomerase [Nitrososphaera sp.]